jgi:hypothetical protein
MMRIGQTTNGYPEVKAHVADVAVFLDQFAMKKLAKEDPDRRRRFTEAIRSGADLLFSVANAAELTGPTGSSFQQMKDFLSDLGPHWFPVEMDPKMISDREVAGESTGDSCSCKKFVKDFYNDRVIAQPRNRLIDLSEQFFDLGWTMEWLTSQRQSVITGKTRLDEVLRERILEHRLKFERDATWLDSAFPPLPFNARFPATFAYAHLMRTLIFEAKGYQLVKGDGIDFCQAVVASAFATLATLDKHWKRRVETLPRPHQLARIYAEGELDAFVEDLESKVRQRDLRQPSAAPLA